MKYIVNSRSIIFFFFYLFNIFPFAYSEDEDFRKYAMFLSNAQRPNNIDPITTTLPLKLKQNARIALVGNTLFDRMRDYGHFEALLQKAHPNLNLVLRNLAWSADEIDLQPRPDNFADTEQHLTAMKADVIVAAFGFNVAIFGVLSATANCRRNRFAVRSAVFLCPTPFERCEVGRRHLGFLLA